MIAFPSRKTAVLSAALLASGIVTGLAATSAHAQSLILAENRGLGNGFSGFIPGQSVTTPGGGSFNNITFSFFDGANNPEALGTLYLFSQEYTGTSTGLASSTFLAKSQSIQNGAYVFGSNAILQGATQYFLYSDTAFDFEGSVDIYQGGTLYLAPPPGSFSSSSYDATFRLRGSAVTAAAPEANSGALVASVLSATLLFVMVKAGRKKATATV